MGWNLLHEYSVLSVIEVERQEMERLLREGAGRRMQGSPAGPTALGRWRAFS